MRATIQYPNLWVTACVKVFNSDGSLYLEFETQIQEHALIILALMGITDITVIKE